MNENVRDNKERRRFELPVDGHVAFSDYRRSDGVLTILHTEVPRELGGQGIGSALVRGLLDQARANGEKVRPLCSFVRAYIEKHPDDADLLA